MTHPPLPCKPRPLSSQILGFAGWLLVVFSAAALGAIASVDAAAFYAQLDKPVWAPPAWVFSPVWTTLYFLMSISVWLVWRRPPLHQLALALFLAQLVANTLWSWLFFTWHLGALATIEVFILLLLIAATMAAFWQSNRLAAMLLAPYLVWVGFAAALTWTVWRNNLALL